MELQQTMEETALFLFSDSEDESSPSKKRGKFVSDLDPSELFLDLGLQEQTPNTGDQWEKMFDFQYYRPGPPEEDFEDMFIKCKNELKAVKKAYNRATVFFEHIFGDLDKKHPCDDSSNVVETIRSQLKRVKNMICTAKDLLPSFWPDVRTYTNFRDTTLLELKSAEDQYYKKLEELAETSNVDKLVEMLITKVKHYDWIKCTGLETFHIQGISRFLMKKYGFHCEESNMITVEEFDQSDMEKVVTENKDLIDNIRSSWEAYETARPNVEEEGWKHECKITRRMNCLVGCLKKAGFNLKYMRGQFELLCTKNVIVNGFDEDFYDDWIEFERRDGGVTYHFYV